LKNAKFKFNYDKISVHIFNGPWDLNLIVKLLNGVAKQPFLFALEQIMNSGVFVNVFNNQINYEQA
jgi:hypothetical protein